MTVKRVWIVALIAVTLLLVAGMGQGAAALPLAHAAKDGTGVYAVQIQAAAGGRYHLDSGDWRVQGVSGGSGYHLEVVVAPAGSGIPCCCTYLTCIQRRQP
jgi:hypothetical protein